MACPFPGTCIMKLKLAVNGPEEVKVLECHACSGHN